MELIKSHRCHGGTVNYYTHRARRTNCDMMFTLFLPPQAKHQSVPMITFLSGLTTTPENFTTKAMAYKKAAELGIAILNPDSSPRGDDVMDESGISFGKGASYYMDAQTENWRDHYQMESYIARELFCLMVSQFPVKADKQGLMGHSMGGYGALALSYKYAYQYQSVSALAPVSNLLDTERGREVLTKYIGSNQREWPRHDPCYLVRDAAPNILEREILIDIGADDPYYGRLRTDLFKEACKSAGQNLTLRTQPSYDHSYFFVQSFINDHLDHHAQFLL